MGWLPSWFWGRGFVGIEYVKIPEFVRSILDEEKNG